MFFSILVFFPIYFRSGNKNNSCSLSDKKRGAFLILPLLAGFIKGIDYYFAGSSLHLTTVAHSTILNNLSPLWCVGLSYIVFGRKLHLQHLVGALIAFLGLTIVFRTQDAIKIGRGELYAVIASIFYGAYFVITQKGREYLNNTEYYFWLIVSTGFFMFVLNILKGEKFFCYPREEVKRYGNGNDTRDEPLFIWFEFFHQMHGIRRKYSDTRKHHHYDKRTHSYPCVMTFHDIPQICHSGNHVIRITEILCPEKYPANHDAAECEQPANDIRQLYVRLTP